MFHVMQHTRLKDIKDVIVAHILLDLRSTKGISYLQSYWYKGMPIPPRRSRYDPFRISTIAGLYIHHR